MLLDLWTANGIVDLERIGFMRVYQSGQQVDAPGRVNIDNASSQYAYIGEATPDSADADNAWSIRRIEYDALGAVVAVRWAERGARICSWDQRAALTY